MCSLEVNYINDRKDHCVNRHAFENVSYQCVLRLQEDDVKEISADFVTKHLVKLSEERDEIIIDMSTDDQDSKLLKIEI